MKPRLIKFTCPACNARLAVPGAMAGMEDNCPKCAARIKAPVPEPEPAPAADAEPAPPADPKPGKSKHSILDAVLHAPELATRASRTTKSQKSAAAPGEREAQRSVLLDEFLSTAPRPPEEPVAEAPSEGSPSVRSKPLKAAKPQRGPKPGAPLIAPPANLPVPDSAPAPAQESPTALEKIPAAVPKPVSPPPEPDNALRPAGPDWRPPARSQPDSGMADMITEPSSSPSPASNRNVPSSLGVGLMQVEDRPQQHRSRRRRRAIVMGILLFLLFDAAIFCWIFRHRIFEWWHERRPVAVTQQAAARPSPKSPAATPPLKPATNLATTTSGESSSRSPAAPPPAPPGSEPDKPVPALIPQAPLPPNTANAPAPGELRPAPPVVSATPGNQTGPSPREVGDTPGKKDYSAAQIAPPVPGSPSTPDPPKTPMMTLATTELLTTLDVPLLISPKPAETPGAAGKDDLKLKIEMAPPPSPPPLPPGPGMPEASLKPATLEPSPGLPAVVDSNAPPAPAKIVETGITAAARPALAAVKGFLAAPTWQERLRWVQKPDTVKAAMEKHYRNHPDGPVNVARIDLIERYPARGGNPPYCMFEARGGDLKHSILVLVEEKSRTDIRVDWEAFVEFKDQLLWEFLLKPGSPPGKFRVMIRRRHSFDKDVPDLDRKEAFELSQPGADTTANVYSVKGAAATRTLAQQLGWGQSVAVTVQLAWHGEGDGVWVEVKAVPAFGWRG